MCENGHGWGRYDDEPEAGLRYQTGPPDASINGQVLPSSVMTC